jgi:hypothetical protein
VKFKIIGFRILEYDGRISELLYNSTGCLPYAEFERRIPAIAGDLLSRQSEYFDAYGDGISRARRSGNLNLDRLRARTLRNLVDRIGFEG